MDYFDFRSEGHDLDEFEEILMLSYTNRPMADRLQEHVNDGIEICVAQYGLFEWVVEGKETSIKNGEISITLPWQKHSGKESIINKGKLAFILVKPKLFERKGILDFGGNLPMLTTIQNELGKMMVNNKSVNIGRSDKFSNLLLMLGRELSNKKVGYQASIYLCLSQMMIEIYRLLKEKKEDQAGYDERIDRAINEIDSNISYPWTNSALENLTGYKKTALNRHFKGMTGFAPMSYVTNQKIVHAKDQLRQGKTITDIAYELNFSSSQHFSSVFKQHTGSAPSSYRKNIG